MKCLIVDDHALIREAMAGVLAQLDPQAVAVGASTLAQALQCCAQDVPDLVLLDVALPDGSGLDLLAALRRQYPGVAVVMLSGILQESVVRQAIAGGASGFIAKVQSREEVADALRHVLQGGMYVPPDVRWVQGGANGAMGGAAPAGLTPRQRDVLALLMAGRSNKQICRELDLAEPTVKNHVSAILRELGAASRTAAVLEATRRGWGPGGGSAGC